MKNLMIAAAVAAMIGGAYADLAYDFTANIKTTGGKDGSSTSTVTYYLGCDENGKFWYNDDTVLNQKALKPTYFTTKRIGGKTVDTLTAAAKKDYAWLNDDLDIATLAAIYDVKSQNKWCETIKTVDEKVGCYRVTKSETIKTVMVTADCCTDDFADNDGNVISFFLKNRFGGVTKAKATKLEVCGYINGGCYDETCEDCYNLAGQGTWKDNLVKANGTTYAGISSISGSIVGLRPAPSCEYCCHIPTAAYAWDCDADPDNEDEGLATAAYGTWTMKFNKGKSDL